MSRENEEVVRRGWRAYSERDLDALLANFTEDAEWRLIGGFADLMGSRHKGRAALRRFFAEWIDTLGGFVEEESVREVDDRVVAIVRAVAGGGRSGAPATMRWAQVFTFRDGKISAVDNYYEVSDALAAVGLKE